MVTACNPCKSDVDYRKLNNKITKHDSYQLPRIDDLIESVGQAEFFSTLDLKSGYFGISMEEKDKQKTAFSTPDGHFEFNTLAFGLTNAPAINTENFFGMFMANLSRLFKH